LENVTDKVDKVANALGYKVTEAIEKVADQPFKMAAE
jgi:hypothetical protein